jgi:non-specific serine/threonine protein kinase
MFWFAHGHARESIRWLEKFLEQGRHRKDISPSLTAWALTYLGTILRTSHQGDENESILLHEKSLKLFRKLKDRSGNSWVLNQLGVIALQDGDLYKAEKLFKESLAIRREIGDPWSISQSLGNFASLALEKNDLEKAKEYAEESLTWCQRTGNRRNTARTLTDLGDIARLEGDTSRAITLLTQALSQVIPLGDKETITGLLISLAVLAVEQHQFKRGALLLGSAESLSEEMGMPYRGLGYDGYTETAKLIRKNLGDSKFQQTWRQGRNMSLETILDYAMQTVEPTISTMEFKSEEDTWLQLTLRERDVMKLLAQGHSNLEISQTLFLSEKTVRNHISNIYRKLQTKNRGEIILLAHKLVPHTDQ